MAAIFFQVGRAVAGPVFAPAAFVVGRELMICRHSPRCDPIDTHVHAFKSDPAITDLLVRLHLHVLDICVADSQRSFGGLAAETARARSFVQASQNHASLCVTFDPFTFEQKDFARTQ